MFDLIVFPFSIEAGRETYNVPGFLATEPPRKAARMRAQDILFLYWKPTLTGPSTPALTGAQQQEILGRLAQSYYTTPGSVTAGLDAVVDRLNDLLLNRNLRSGQGGQVSAVLTLAVLRRDTMVIAHAGSTHTFVLKKSASHHFDDGQASRGLGLSRQAVVRFHQSTIEAGDFVLFCAEPPAAWARWLTSGPQGSLEHLRRRLISDSGVEMQAVAVRFQPGSGKITTFKPGTRTSPTADAHTGVEGTPAQPPSTPLAGGMQHTETVEQPASADSQPAQTFPPPPAAELSAQVAGEPSAASPVFLARPVETQHTPPRPRPELGQSSARSAAPATQTGQPRPSARQRAADRSGTHSVAPAAQPEQVAASAPAGPPPGEILRQQMASTWRAGRAARSNVNRAVSSVTSKILPRQVEPVSTGWLLAIAILVPLVVVTIASAVYFQTGRSEQFQVLFVQAQQAAQQAAQISDPVQQKEAWTRVTTLLTAAERYRSNEETKAIRQQAQTALDTLQGLTRLEFIPAVNSELGPNVVVSRIVAKLNQVYLLDSSEGRIMSMARVTSGGYEVNAFFICGPGQAGGAIIGPLIDLAEIPVNNTLSAEIMGIDAGGNLVYCGSGKTTFDSRPLVLPDSGWGQIAGITTYGDLLYVLDPKANMVYYYVGDKGIFAEAPRLYFDLEIPNLSDVIDLAVDQEFLYLLHQDGQMTVCTASGATYANTRCNDPMPYGDSRAGYEPSPLQLPGARLAQIQTTQPPDPSLFALDIENKSVYHLSLRRLNLQRQYLSQTDADFPFPNRAPSAFAVTPNRRVLVAFDNQVYFSALP